MAGNHTPSDYAIRLKEAMALNGLIDEQGKRRPGALAPMAKALGITVSAIEMLLNGPTKAFNPANSAKAARFLKVDHYWLATGEGEPRPPGLSEIAQEFGRRYDKLDQDGRRRFEAALLLVRPGVADKEVEKAMPITAKKAKQQTQES